MSDSNHIMVTITCRIPLGNPTLPTIIISEVQEEPTPYTLSDAQADLNNVKELLKLFATNIDIQVSPKQIIGIFHL